MYEENIILPFGRFKGQRLDQIPDEYLMWITNSDMKNQDYWQAGKREFKVPADIQLGARLVLQSRGYKRKGTRWEV